jgi:hypothetical protein
MCPILFRSRRRSSQACVDSGRAYNETTDEKTLPVDRHLRGSVRACLGLGWRAGAIVGTQTVVVKVNGTAANEERAIALLKDTIKRKAGK